LIDSLEADEAAQTEQAAPVADPTDAGLAPANDDAAESADDSVLAFDDEDSDEDAGSELEGPDLVDATETEAREA
jgi:hypothetical protein